MFRENVHKADLENGYFLNPILNGDYADPAVFREENVYYLCVSTGKYMPGLTIFQSEDLVNWEILCNPLNDSSINAWAPDILKYDNRYYIYFSSNGTNYVIWSEFIDKGWCKPIDLKVGNIDPGHVMDEECNRFLFLSNNYLVPLCKDGLSVSGSATQVLLAPELPDEWEVEGHFPEAPNVFRKGDYYYLTYADGGTKGPATSHMIMAARAKKLNGPWELSPYNPVVHTWNRNEKWISKGHGHFVEDIEGKWWVIYHAYENGYETHGRKLLLSAVTFTEDGWFQVNQDVDLANIKPKGGSIACTATLSDDFSDTELKKHWKAINQDNWERYQLQDNHLIIEACGLRIQECHPLTIITGDHSYDITIHLMKKDRGVKAGIILQYDEEIFNALSWEEGELVVYRIGNELWHEKIKATELWLKMQNREQYISFYYSINGIDYRKLSPVINTVSQNANAYDDFLSLRPGIFVCGSGSAQFENFVYAGRK